MRIFQTLQNCFGENAEDDIQVRNYTNFCHEREQVRMETVD